MAIIIKQKISNHKVFTDVERFVVITRIAENADVKQITIDAHVCYERDGVDVTSNFKSKISNWIISNHYRVKVRDGNNAPIPNPDHDESDTNSEEFLMQPAFDYYHSLILANEVPLLTLLSTSILNDDEQGAFDF